MSQELATRLLAYSKIEEEYARKLVELGESLNHPVLRTIFLSIARDSEKHGMIYKALSELVSNPQPFITEKEFENIRKVISNHIETEAKMLKVVDELLHEAEDSRVKLLLAAIRDDEVKHHALLASIRDKLASLETLTEQKLWDMVWKESPWHGTPGG